MNHLKSFSDRISLHANNPEKITFQFSHRNAYENVEVAERKGVGHPDTLADMLAMHLSRVYSTYCIENFGFILHHNFDKVGLMGGKAFVSFGKGIMRAPIRVLINGRASVSFGDRLIPVRQLLEGAARAFLVQRLPNVDADRDIIILYEVQTGSSPGQVHVADAPSTRSHWFAPRDEADLPYLRSLFANDTSTGAGYAPLTNTASLLLTIETHMTGSDFREQHPWIGTDIKLTGVRCGTELHITACIPQLCLNVLDVQQYKINLETARVEILRIANAAHPELRTEVSLNMRDNYDMLELYLTLTGSSIEMGDEGFVGRGNRVNGVIDMNRPYSMEGACGKNPVYHIGMLYSVAAQRIAQRIFAELGTSVEVFLSSQTGQPLTQPWQVIINTVGKNPGLDELRRIALEELSNIPSITIDFLEDRLRLC